MSKPSMIIIKSPGKTHTKTCCPGMKQAMDHQFIVLRYDHPAMWLQDIHGRSKVYMKLVYCPFCRTRIEVEVQNRT